MSQDLQVQERTVTPPPQAVSFSLATLRKSLPLGKVFSYLVVFFIAFLYIFPLLYLLNVSVKSPSDYLFQPSGLAKGIDLTNYTRAWVQGNFAQYLGNSLLYTLVSTAISVTLSLFAAFPIARGYVKWGSFWYVFFLAAVFLPSPLIPQFQLMLHLGLYNTQIGYILLNSGVGLGPFLIVGYLRSVPKELDEAACIDGCGYFRFIFTMIVPLIKPILVTVFLLGAINVWNDIIGPTIYLADDSLYPVSLGLFSFYGQYQNQWTVLAAGIILVAAPLVILYIFLQRYFMDGALAGAFK
jgi:raffinose/stachyose/melibiose transport system permease protein